MANALLFTASLPASRLKDLVASAAPVTDVLHLRLDTGDESHKLRFWGTDSGKVCAMEGMANDALFQAWDGDDAAHTIQIGTKYLADCVGALRGKKPVSLSLEQDSEDRLFLILRQEDGDHQRDARRILVEEAEGEPLRPAVPDGAYAAVDLEQFKKVLAGIKKNSDILHIEIAKDTFSAAVQTKKVQDGWKHATSTTGRAVGLFGVGAIQKVVRGAAQIGSFGEIHLSEDHPLLIEAVAEDFGARFFVAAREAMR